MRHAKGGTTGRTESKAPCAGDAPPSCCLLLPSNNTQEWARHNICNLHARPSLAFAAPPRLRSLTVVVLGTSSSPFTGFIHQSIIKGASRPGRLHHRHTTATTALASLQFFFPPAGRRAESPPTLKRGGPSPPPPPIAVASSATQATGRCHWSPALCSLLAAWARRLLAVESGEGWPALDGWAAWGRNDSTDTVRSIDKPASQASTLVRLSSARSTASPFENPDTSISSVCGTAMERPMRP